jgi:hypothetical protein
MSIQINRTTIMMGLVVLLALGLGLLGVLPAFSQVNSDGDEPVLAAEINSAVSEAITYQGRLTDDNGDPLSGNYTMRFRLYNVPSGGSALFDSGNLTMPVVGGLFTVSLPVPQNLFDGQPLWLLITVGGQNLSPRQEIRPAPYAMSLRPGAQVRQVATGTALRVESTQGIGLQGTGRVYGVYGNTSGAPIGSGYGGYFESGTGIGVHGRSTAPPSGTNLLAPGVSGYSQNGVGILGQAATGFGVYGTTAGSGVGGVGQVYGVYGRTGGVAQGAGYGGYFESNTGIGVSGRSTALLTGTNFYAPGVYGHSHHGAGVMGEAGPGSSSVAGLFFGNVVVDGDLVVTGTKTGYVVDVARNDSHEPLTQGDLVIVTGAADPVLGNIPVPLVRLADSEASTAVIGVVDSIYRLDVNGPDRSSESVINPGDYLTIVTLGAFTAVKVDASYGAIQPGDLLVSSPTPGHAMRADNPAIGTVIGKALSSLESGTGSVAIMVTLQ